MDSETRVLLLLSAQRALLGEVGPHLQAVCAGVRDNTVAVTFFVTPEATEDEREDLSNVAGGVIGDFTDDFMLDESVVEVDPTSTSYVRPTGEWVFMRREFAERARILQSDA